MRKTTIIGRETADSSRQDGSWLNLEDLATAELSSEDSQHPFEQSLRTGSSAGWKASSPGPQLIRLRFDRPTAIRRIHLQFREAQIERSQEIALFATTATSPRREMVRQQWAFSPSGSTTEVEDYYFDLKDVTIVELEIDPGRHNKQVFASLESIQIG